VAFLHVPRSGAAEQPALRELEGRLEVMLDHERTSRFQHAFRELKLSLLERI